MHKALTVLGVPRENHAAVIAMQEQIATWEREHPGEDALLSGECDHLFIALGQASGIMP